MKNIKETENTVFFKYKSHPFDVSRKKTRDLYKLACKATDENRNSLKILPTTGSFPGPYI